jgi:lipopolysaccharide transport system permease protein
LNRSPVGPRAVVIEPGGTQLNYWRDLWRYRELFYFLAWRDILVRYKQTVIGVAWALIRPLLIMVVFTIIFGKLGKFPSNGVPYPLLVFCAVLPWQFFATAVTEASGSLVGNTNLISKIYFPRLIIPASSLITSLVDFLISFAILGVLLIWYDHPVGWRLAAIPLLAGFAFATALGFSVWLAALNVKYRDFRYVIPFILQLGLYISPVGFTSDVIAEEWRVLYSLNPMVGVIDGFRWAILGTANPLYVPGLVMSASLVLVLLVSGFAYFRRTERSFADII